MTKSKSIDPERLAALIDGRLDPAEAAEVRAQLGNTDDDAVALFADAIAIADSKEQVLPIARRRARWGWSMSLSAAAAILLVAVFMSNRWHRDFDRYGPSAFAAAVPRSALLLETPVWGASRGSTAAPTDMGRWIRLGALATDLHVATARNDTASQRIADAFAANIADVPGTGSLPSDIRALAGNIRDSVRLRETIARAAGFGDSVLVSSGAWLEAARMASESSDSAFFSLYPAEQRLASIRKRPLKPIESATIERVLQMSGTRPWDFRQLTERVAAALAALAQ